MAITKILAHNKRMDVAIKYVTNGSKTEDQILTAYLNCDPGRAYQQMMETKEEIGKAGGRQCYHIIQSFQPGEITPELALKIAVAFAEECLPGYEAVIGTHVDTHVGRADSARAIDTKRKQQTGATRAAPLRFPPCRAVVGDLWPRSRMGRVSTLNGAVLSPVSPPAV